MILATVVYRCTTCGDAYEGKRHVAGDPHIGCSGRYRDAARTPCSECKGHGYVTAEHTGHDIRCTRCAGRGVL